MAEKAGTACENLPEEAASLYERARFSTHSITEDEAQQFKAATERIWNKESGTRRVPLLPSFVQ